MFSYSGWAASSAHSFLTFSISAPVIGLIDESPVGSMFTLKRLTTEKFDTIDYILFLLKIFTFNYYSNSKMPPKKKKEAAEQKIILGRASNTLRMGLVGLPNVGKSTTFNILSNLSVPAENYPFCTIDPSEAKVFVPDRRFERLCGIYNPRSKVAASISIFDIAGLVAGASEGEGLGNAFLSHIQAVDGIFHVVRAFPNEEVMHNEGDVNPVRDLEIITNELF